MTDKADDGVVKVKKARTVRGKGLKTRTSQTTISQSQENLSKDFFENITKTSLHIDKRIAEEDVVDDDVLVRGEEKENKSSETQACTPDQLLILSDEEEDNLLSVPEEVGVPEIRSPSPPPPPKASNIRKAMYKRGKQKTKLLNAVSELNQDLQYVQTILQQGPKDDIEADVCVVEDENAETVRVQIHGVIQRYNLQMDDAFSIIMSKVAEKEGVDDRFVMLVYNDTTIRPTDTPASINFKPADIIECHVLDANNPLETSFDESSMIELVMQSKASKHKTQMKAYKSKPLSVLLEDYAKKMKKDPSCLLLRFDGDIIKPSDSAESLDLETGDILDIQETDIVII